MTAAADDATAPATPAGVESALAELTRLDGLPVDAHVDVYERVHRQLQDAMSAADES